ncbi:MAG TPA: tripartite tricarboxylate transporter permease [Candidatus Methylomirabilis sp.]|nr:tripartite tricarboxylate transporter permease [Candidatus Methylomirabilis sp.]
MDFFGNILLGFQTTFQPINLLYCFVGCIIGTAIGVLPGIGPTGAVSILLPVTFKISPVTSVILLAGIYYGAMYGGSTTSILVNVPGEAASVVTCLDGYQMARRGRAGPALGIAAFGSFIAGTFSVIALMFLSYPLSKFALAFGPPEYTALIILGITILTYLAQKSMIKALMMAAFGFLLAFVGIDMLTGRARYTFGVPGLMDGIGILPIAMGLFGVTEVLENLGSLEEVSVLKTKLGHLLPDLQDWKDSWKPITRGSLIGFLVGIIPGGNATLASFVSYAAEKRCSKHPERFGQGAIEGVAGPESANNSAFGGGMVPLFALGIPTSVACALLFAALMMHGVQPGPFLIPEHPDIFWGLVASMYLGNIMLLIINLPLIGMWVQVLKVPASILLPLILFFCIVGAYAANNSFFDVGVMMVFGVLGYLMKKFDYEAAPLILAFVLGPILENSMRQSLKLSGGDFGIFVSRPVSVTLLGLAGVVLLSNFFFKGKRDVLVETEAKV